MTPTSHSQNSWINPNPKPQNSAHYLTLKEILEPQTLEEPENPNLIESLAAQLQGLFVHMAAWAHEIPSNRGVGVISHSIPL